jgi:hypothetical protein
MEEMTPQDLSRIIDILMEKEESDLITKLRIHFDELFDDDAYRPPRRIKKESYSDSEGSAEEEEEYYTIEDDEGFMSLA